MGGGYMAMLGICGCLLASCASARCLTYIYVTLLWIAVMTEAATAVALKANKKWAEDFFLGSTCGTGNYSAGKNCTAEVANAERFFDEHESQAFVVILAAIALQVFAGLF